MSIARHHAEWLSLVPVSGPFLSLPVLMEAFNAGLEPHDPEHSRLLRQEYGNWLEAIENRRGDPAPHRQWIKFVLGSTLDLDERVLVEGQAIPQTLQVEIPEHHELLRPSFVVVDPGSKKPRMLVQTYPRSQELTSYVANSPWKASPDTRMTELLHGTGVRLGLVTNGEHWMLVDAPKGETTGYASWYANLWLDEPITLRAFRSLLSAGRFFGVPDDQTLEKLLEKSASNQQEVTDQLGYQVRRAVEVLIHSLDRADQDFGRELLAGVGTGVLYESALTVMMRLVFLFCAEERELIPSKPFPVYEQNYSVSTISKQLREVADQHGEELLQLRFDAWPRLLAAFRAVYGGLAHDDAHIPAYGGNLFDPDRFPFLEGRKTGTTWREAEANPLPVDNRTVLHLLEALQLLQVRVPGGGPAEARRVSFRALDIEQIGHVYEGLLDQTARRATEPYLGLAGTRDKEPEIPLAELERLGAKGEADLVKFLKEETGRSEPAHKKALGAEIDDQLARLFRTACQGDEVLWGRVRPFAGLVRLDNFGYPVVITMGSVFVTEGTDRRSSGTHYTPRELTEPIVKHTLEPLVYVGPAEGKPKDQWRLKSAKELLDLKICDMACGSGAFLVQAARYMAERLLEAWDEARKANPSTPGITPEGEPSGGWPTETLIPDEPAERATYAMRIIAQRCLYGVDKNPLAAEMAKLSLWLLTVAKDKPFEFLDHAIRCGDSLVGLLSLDQLRHFSLKPDADDAVLFRGPLDTAVDEAIDLRLRLEGMPANSIEDVERQEALLKEADEKIARLRCAADLLVAAEFWGENTKDKLERVRHAAVVSGYYVEKGTTEEFEEKAAKERRGQLMFHWPLEYPEVIVKQGGFNAFVGNPPFMGGRKISSNLGDSCAAYIKGDVLDGAKGSINYVLYFMLRACSLAGTCGATGFIATDSITESDTREVGMSKLFERAHPYRAVSSQPWPGDAGVRIAILHQYKGGWKGKVLVDDSPCDAISTMLEPGITLPDPYPLGVNAGFCSDGVKVQGIGFVIDEDEANRVIGAEPSASAVITRYIVGDDINNHPNQLSDRWIVNFWNRTEEDCARYTTPWQIVRERVKPYRDTLSRQVHEACFWKFWDRREEFFNRVKEKGRVLVASKLSKYLSLVFGDPNYIYSEKVKVFDFSTFTGFSVLQSSFHSWWALQWGSTTGETPAYVGSRCFDTFPFPRCLRGDNGCLLSQGYERELEVAGSEYYEARRRFALDRSMGLTDCYNLFHDPNKRIAETENLRDLHRELDRAVASAYDWDDLDLGHDFHETKQGIRFTICEPARRDVLQRLLKLNHERHAEEVKQGLHGKESASRKAAPKRKTTTSRTSKTGPSLFDVEEDDA